MVRGERRKEGRREKKRAGRNSSACQPSTQETEALRSWVRGQPELHGRTLTPNKTKKMESNAGCSGLKPSFPSRT